MQDAIRMLEDYRRRTGGVACRPLVIGRGRHRSCNKQEMGLF